MERESFDVTDHDWDTEKSSDVGSVVSGSSPLIRGNLASVKDKRISLAKRLASVSNQLKPLTSVSGKTNKSARLDRRKSMALKGLRFINKADGATGWSAVERRFVEITATSDGLLPRSRFGECIGMESVDFALELFDALASRRLMRQDIIDGDQLREFWEQISDQSFVSRLQTFFDILGNKCEIKPKGFVKCSIDKDANGRLTEDQVSQIINLSSSTNNLPNIQRKTDEYAAMIMEELDPDDMGYIMLETTRDPKPLKRWYSGLRNFVSDSWQTTSMHLAVPVAFPACEILIRPFRSSISRVTILKVSVYPENVLSLHMSRPINFKYESGQYMFINCPTISTFEWHPFSITSAPQDDYLSVHIKVMGDWTNALKEVFYKMYMLKRKARLSSMLGYVSVWAWALAQVIYMVDRNRRSVYPLALVGRYSKHGFPKIMIDGPYNAPAQDYRKYKVVLLVGLGIGATPMISIVKDIINNTEAREHSQLSRMETRKAYFYWLTNEQSSYSWFKNIMNEVAERDTNGVIEVNNYCTSVYEEGDVRSAFIQMLQRLNYSKNGVDVVSETRVMTHFAKPNWKNVYKQIAMDHYGSHVGVFYCGEVALAEELRQLALEFTHKTATRFSFHKENFYPQC
ncbi:hypothetical protein N665_0846s0015 [Sinapis alba]|nr:hypothetical protein N665_0846s0015 [Sinapis alba]